MPHDRSDAGPDEARRTGTATTVEESMADASDGAAPTHEQAYAPSPAPDGAPREGHADAPSDVGRPTGPASMPDRDRAHAETD